MQNPAASTAHLAVSLVPVQASDAEALVQLRIAAMRESLERLGRFDPQRARDRFLSGFVPAHTRHIVVAGQIVVGFVAVKPGATELLLDHLYIHPTWQGKGIGAAVLRLVFCEADGRQRSIRVGALKESASNRFYERHGFTLVERGEYDNYYVRAAGSSGGAQALPVKDAARSTSELNAAFHIAPDRN